MSKFTVTATAIDHNGARVDANTAEHLGDAYGVEYDSREEAEAVARSLQSDAEDYFPGQGVTYEVEAA